MYLTSAAKRGLIVGAVVLLAAVGVIGWTHRGAAPQAFSQSAPVAAYTEPVSPVGGGPVVYSASPFGSNLEEPPSEPIQPPPAAYPQETTPPARFGEASREYTPHRRVITERRSRKHSLEIVGGSAAGGALIGALAGGGKGAGIGALAGGAGGFLYDRLTHKKRVVVDQ